MPKLPDKDELMMDVSFNKKLAQQVQNNINDIYKKTYYSDNTDNAYIDAIRRQMDQNINGLIDKTRIRTGNTNISDLYAKTLAKNDESMMSELQHVLQDESMLADIMDLYSQNVIIRDMDREIDQVCKYMPKLDEALDIKTDHVLSADHFNQDAVKITVLTGVNNDRETENNSNDIETFKKKYGLDKLNRKLYEKTAKYGEQYLYVVSYNKALSRLVAKSSSGSLLTEGSVLDESILESTITENMIEMDLQYITSTDRYNMGSNNTSLLESVYDLSEVDDVTRKSLGSIPNTESSNLKVEINLTGIIPSLVVQHNNIKRIMNETASVFGEATVKTDNGLMKNAGYLKDVDKNFKKFVKGSLKAPSDLSTDGFVNKDKGPDIDIPGCIVEFLDHTMVKPLYINNVCLGYYYIECDTPLDANEQTTFSSTLGGLRPRRSTRDRENMTSQNMDNAVLLKIARQISQKIDKKFINANQDLAQEIYTILKFNANHADGKVSKIRISFIPPEDMVHSYFDLNDKTHRGRSDLSRSLFIAKLYSCLYISNTIALLTRGYDKRMYHVKQSVDTNITAVLLNVINQIKQSNFNLRQIENMNNILNITGRFNDLVIPQNANGESPISVEVMPGQNVEVKTEFMNMLEEMAVNQTGVSLEMINTRLQENTATHLTMTNSRFLIKIYNRQQLFEEILSVVYTKIYQNEFNTNDTIAVELPPPVMLNFTNTSQIITVANELIQNIVQMKMGAEQDEMVKAAFMGKLMRFYFKSFLPIEDIDKLADEARIEIEAKKPSQQFEIPGMDPNMGGGQQPQY